MCIRDRVRRGLPVLIRRLAAIPGVRDLALTTNGVLLEALAGPLYEAGLRRLNVHLDTLDRGRFRQIARRDDLDKVLAGLEAARRLGYTTIKLNVVAVKNLIEPDIVLLARFGRERGFEVRYIEFMPLDAQNLWDRGKVLLADEIIAIPVSYTHLCHNEACASQISSRTRSFGPLRQSSLQ